MAEYVLQKNTSYKLHTTQLTVELDIDCIDVAFFYTRTRSVAHVCICVFVFQSVGAGRSRSRQRSSSISSMDYSLPRLHMKFGERAFSHAGPTTWNALPDHKSSVADPVKFRKLLKSNYFNQVFNSC